VGKDPDGKSKGDDGNGVTREEDSGRVLANAHARFWHFEIGIWKRDARTVVGPVGPSPV